MTQANRYGPVWRYEIESQQLLKRPAWMRRLPKPPDDDGRFGIRATARLTDGSRSRSSLLAPGAFPTGRPDGTL